MPTSYFPKVSLVGAPTDVGAGVFGADMGPRALREAGLVDALAALGLEVEDLGDVSGPPNPKREAVGGYKNAAEVAAWCGALKVAVAGALERGRLPIMLGGDHCLAIGTVAAVADRCRESSTPLRVFWFDAHADFNTALSTPSGNVHGMPLAALTFDGPPDTQAVVGRWMLDPKCLRLVGIRSVDDLERETVERLGVKIYGMEDLAGRGAAACMADALAGLEPDAHVHVSFDVDFLDPEWAPGVGTRVEGGPGLEQSRECMRALFETGRVGSVDIVELNPSLDEEGKTARAAVEMMRCLFGGDRRDWPRGVRG